MVSSQSERPVRRKSIPETTSFLSRSMSDALGLMKIGKFAMYGTVQYFVES
jgi:hypothetical protein